MNYEVICCFHFPSNSTGDNHNLMSNFEIFFVDITKENTLERDPCSLILSNLNPNFPDFSVEVGMLVLMKNSLIAVEERSNGNKMQAEIIVNNLNNYASKYAY